MRSCRLASTNTGSRHCFSLFYLLLLLCICGNEHLPAQTVLHNIDLPGEPFSYPSHPTDEIGVMYSPSATEITPEGYLYTGFGELMFFIGPDHRPVSQRLHTLAKGYLPIVSYDVAQSGIRYHFEMFSASVGEQPEGLVVNLVRITAQNTGSNRASAYLSTAMPYQAVASTASGVGDHRFLRPAKSTGPGSYQQPGEVFNSDWKYEFDGNAFVRDGKVLYLFSESPAPELHLTFGSASGGAPDISNQGGRAVLPATPVGVASYSFPLAPGERKSVDFLMPLLPVPVGSPELAAMRSADPDALREKAVAFWENLLSRGMSIEVPEKKVVDTFKASLVYDLLALNKVNGQYIQTVNQLHYHKFYLRDSSDFVHMYDSTGYRDIAAEVLRFFQTKQQSDGNFLSQPGQYDGWGETMWIYGEHYRFTHDRAFAELVYPSVVRAVAWLEKAMAADPLHLVPATDLRDNEYVQGHLTGYNFLALDGLQSAVLLAQVLGQQQDAERFQRDYDLLRSNFLTALDRLTAKTGGYIPPSLDENNQGTDWGNLLAVTPVPQLDPWDPRVTATLAEAKAKYQEGIMTYSRPGQGTYLHHYLTIKNTLTHIVRGEQEQAVREMYAELLHTSATQAGFEYSIRPWGDRDFHSNLTPHGWFAAEYRNMLRSMFVREQDDTLHVLSAASPEWFQTGKSITVARAPSYFGEVNYTLQFNSDTNASLSFVNRFNSAPHAIALHLPWFMHLISAEADGERIQPEAGVLKLPAAVQHVELHWQRKPDTPNLSYEQTVADYEKEYRARSQQQLMSGEVNTKEITRR